MFSQYVEDITRNYTNSDSYKVVPTQFVALNIDYKTKCNDEDFKRIVLNKGTNGPNIGIPKYFQNCFENACAYAKNYQNNSETPTWTPKISRNLFWNFMFDGKFLTVKNYKPESDSDLYVPEVVYFDDINMHSYNEHKGMGYNEIYCYIPANSAKKNCGVNVIENRQAYINENDNKCLQGFKDMTTENYEQTYYFDEDFTMTFDNDSAPALSASTESKYEFNTVVLLYSVFEKVDDGVKVDWKPVHTNIPMGIYFTGKFDDNNEMTNTVTKYVQTSYDTGTSYGLRICTRFTAIGNGKIVNDDIVVEDAGYTNMCQLMTAMAENLTHMLDVTKSVINTTQSYKDTLAVIKNNRTNVPYIREIGGKQYWFVNGKLISEVGDVTINNTVNNNVYETTCDCDSIPENIIIDKISK